MIFSSWRRPDMTKNKLNNFNYKMFFNMGGTVNKVDIKYIIFTALSFVTDKNYNVMYYQYCSSEYTFFIVLNNIAKQFSLVLNRQNNLQTFWNKL